MFAPQNLCQLHFWWKLLAPSEYIILLKFHVAHFLCWLFWVLTSQDLDFWWLYLLRTTICYWSLIRFLILTASLRKMLKKPFNYLMLYYNLIISFFINLIIIKWYLYNFEKVKCLKIMKIIMTNFIVTFLNTFCVVIFSQIALWYFKLCSYSLIPFIF